MNHPVLILGSLYIWITTTAANYTIVKDKSVSVRTVCMGEVSSAECPPGSSIIMHSALYGRMEVGRCLSAEFGFVGCTNDVLFLTDRWCSGRKHCEFFIPNKQLDAANEKCSRDLRAFMYMSYSCVSVAHTGGYHCLQGETVSLTQPEGYISSDVTDSTGCGSPRTPWRIEAAAGQVIKISLIDFSALERDGEVTVDYCHPTYAHIVEADLGVNKSVCGTLERRRVVYTSTSNVVEIHMSAAERRMRGEEHRFMIHYEFTGCADLDPPENAWYRRDGAQAVIGCHGSDVTWQMTCSGYEWKGEMGNCTALNQQVASGSQWFTEFRVAILSAVICLTLVLLAVGITLTVCYLKRRRRRTRQLPHPYDEGGQGRCGFANNPYYQPITFEPSPDKQSANSSDSIVKSPPPGMSAAQAKSLMPIWRSPLPNRPASTPPQNPRGSPNRSSGAHNQHVVRSAATKCACVRSSTPNSHREAIENRKNERFQKYNQRDINIKIVNKEESLKGEKQDSVKNHVDDKLADMKKWDCNKHLSNGYHSRATEHIYTRLTKAHMLK